MAKKDTPAEHPEVLYLIHCQDPKGKALDEVSIRVESPNGNWSSISNACGDIVDPGTGLAGVTLKKGKYFPKFYDKSGDQLLYDGSLDAPEWDLAWPPQKPILVGLSWQQSSTGQPGVLPPTPTRAQVCAIQESLQGLIYHTKQYGDIPAWFYPKLNPEDRGIARRDSKAVKDTHIHMSISAAYREHGTLWPDELKEGYDFTQDIAGFRVILHEAICDGFFIDMPLAGDGLGAGPGYNDPVGRTYGHEWLMANLERIIRGLQGDGTVESPDLTPYIIFRPGWDAVFYGWGGDATKTTQASQYHLRWQRIRAILAEGLYGSPKVQPLSKKELDSQQKRVKAFGELFRRILPQGHLAIEHTPGNIPCGEGGGDYAPGGLMTTYDTIMSEFNTVHEDSCWQILGRLQWGYKRPPDQPAGDDPNPPYYLSPGNPRGEYFYVAFEPTKGGVYEWCRGACSLADVQAVDRYLRDCGCKLTGYSGLL